MGKFNVNFNFRQLWQNFYWDMGVDLGSNSTRIFLRDRGVVIDEPTMLARMKKKRWTGLSAPRSREVVPLAFGQKAKEILNREPQLVEVVSPIKNGIIADLEAVESLVAYYLKLVYEVPSKYPKLFKPRVLVSVPSYATEVQKRAVRSVFYKAGAREVVLIEGVVLAASGLIQEKMMTGKTGTILMDIGGGKTEVAVISLGGVVVGKSSKVAGNELDAAIINYIKMKYGLLIGQNSAERVKMEIGNVGETKGEGKSALLRGRDLETGLPRSIKVGEGEIREAIIFETQKIAKLVMGTLDETPPELMEDILKRGIVLVGGGANLRGMDKLIEKETKINTKVSEESSYCVIRGVEELLENPSLLEMIKVVGGIRR